MFSFFDLLGTAERLASDGSLGLGLLGALPLWLSLLWMLVVLVSSVGSQKDKLLRSPVLVVGDADGN